METCRYTLAVMLDEAANSVEESTGAFLLSGSKA
jgi:hypothetical protein